MGQETAVTGGGSVELLGTERIGKLFWRYALPGMAAMLAMAVQSIADGLIVGRLLGSAALAGVNIAMPAYTLVTTVALILGVGTQARMALHSGAGEYGKVRSALWSGLAGLLAFAAAGTVFINVFAEDIVRVLGADEELAELSAGYLHGVMPWLVGLCVFLFIDYILKALGHPKFSMAVMVSTIALNILLSLVFVGRMGLGTFGAGLGTGVSFTAGSLAYAVLVFRAFRKTERLAAARGRFSLRTLWNICYNGSSEGMSEISFGITTFLFNITLMEYAGKEGVAAFTLINYLLFIEISIMIGVSNGMVPVVGYNYGAGLGRRVMRTVRTAAVFNFLAGCCFALLFLFAGEYLVGMFLQPSERTVFEITLHGTRIIAATFLFNGCNILAASCYTAIDRPGMSLLVSALRGLVFIVIGIFLLPPLLGVDGIWLNFPLADLLTAAVVACCLPGFLRRVGERGDDGLRGRNG